MYDVIIVGAGPSGIFSALGVLRKKPEAKILLIEKGESLERRFCPKEKVGKCLNCETCAITAGFSGAGAFSDGKLSLSPDVGGDLPELIGRVDSERLIKEADGLYLSYGAEEKIEGLSDPEKVKEIRRRAIVAGLKLIDCPIRHLGTEKAHELYLAIERDLKARGAEMRFSSSCNDLIIENGEVRGVFVQKNNSSFPERIESRYVVVAAGRRGAEWLSEICGKYGIFRHPGPVDIGVRVEVRNEVMEELNDVLYEAKLVGYPLPFKDKVRTFCQNPGGFVAQENYDNGLAVVNGHSYKERKSDNTNLSILCSHNFNEPFHEPIAYAQKVGELTNMLGAGHILVQRFGDILDGKRTWQKELSRSNLVPTLIDAAAGDITAAMPYRTMTDIINFIKALDQVVPGFASKETLLYSPELKFYSNKIEMDEKLHTNVPHLFCLGDASGWTRGLMMASVMGLKAAESLLDDLNAKVE